MTDTDPRLEAVAEAIEGAGMLGPNNPPWWAGIIVAAFDAIRAFDQAQTPVLGSNARSAEDEPNRAFESPDRGQHNATAPIMGADPPWLDEAVKVASDCYFGFGPSGHCEGWSNVVRRVLAFANAQPPSDREVEAAHRAYIDSYATGDLRAYLRAALIAAAKARSGA